ncbi:MAG: O-antigen ligase family protein, partial [Anaeroplasmataceae bacterium]|nr:O-antigen ligase family protein [Anaeroplasmataceae bacterium]
MMTAIQNKYHQLNTNALRITKMKYFNEIYAGILALITILGWSLNSVVGMLVMIILASLALLITGDLKYVIPNCIFFIFIFSDGFANNSFPIPIIVFSAIFGVIILIYSFKDGFHLKKMKSILGLAGLAITSIIPIIWCQVPKGNEVFYFLFFGNLGYLLLYMIMANGIKEKGVDLLAVSMSYLAIILACECALKVYELKDTVDSIFDLWYFLGWGLCNEAGIMICVSLPFVFYLIGKQEKLTGMIFQNFKIIIGVIGIILTTSRGAYLFGLLEVGILYCVLMFTAKKARIYQNAFLVYTCLILLLILCLKPQVTKMIDSVLNLVFSNKLDDNGRMKLWVSFFDYWKKDPVTIIFGPGMTCSIQHSQTSNGFQSAPQVFHSTILETLTAGGIIGLIFMGIHLVQKYIHIKRSSLLLFVTVGVGYFIVDIYGLIDNTYHMFYYMLPMAVV